MGLELKDIIRRHRKVSGLTQLGLAKLAGVGKTVVFDIEHGKRSVQLDTLGKILDVLNIKLAYESPLMSRLEDEVVAMDRVASGEAPVRSGTSDGQGQRGRHGDAAG